MRTETSPAEELEHAITQAWQETFRIAPIGPDTNFFELGGNSLLAMDLTELLQTRLGIEVPALTLYQYPTIHEMAELIATAATA